MDLTRLVYMILRCLAYIALFAVVIIFILFVCAGCGKKTKTPYQYENRMKFAGNSDGTFGMSVWIDTETGVCYAVRNGASSSPTVLVDRDGRPFIANGWRDFGAED